MDNHQNFDKESPLNVLFYWKVPEQLQNYIEEKFQKFFNINLIFLDKLEGEAFDTALEKSQIIVGWRPKREHLDKAKNLQVYVNPGAGITHLIKMFRELNQERKIILINGHGNAYFTAQHTVALLLAVMNKVEFHHTLMKEGVWRTGDEEGKSIPLRFKSVGLLGYGHVNQLVHKFLSNFDIEFNILKFNWSESLKNSLAPKISTFNPDHLEKFLKNTDILIIAVPLTKKSENLITSKEIGFLKPNSFLVNVSRGPVVNEKDLYEALKNNRISGAAIDVWYNYSPDEIDGKKYPYSYPFHELLNIIMSPHRAASPMDDLKRWDEIIDNIKVVLINKGSLRNVVDLENEY
jgi:phosphoglycerate dehydrogenase-like enzyme